MMQRRFWVVTALAAALGACAQVPRQAALETVTPSGVRQWQGRMALRTEGDRPQSMTANFELQGRPEQGRLSLATPLGTQLFLAAWAPSDAVLKLPNEERRYSNMAELTSDAVGAALPVEALFDWLDGRPVPAWPSVPTDEGFEQQGWQVDTREHERGRLALRRVRPAPLVAVRLVFAH